MKKYNKIRVAAYLLAGSLATISLAGCSNNNISNYYVLTLKDGSKDIAKKERHSHMAGDYCFYYTSAITGGKYLISGDSLNIAEHDNWNDYDDIVNVENIVSYMTSEEKVKAVNTSLTKEEIETILTRSVAVEEQEKQKTLVK